MKALLMNVARYKLYDIITHCQLKSTIPCPAKHPYLLRKSFKCRVDPSEGHLDQKDCIGPSRPEQQNDLDRDGVSGALDGDSLGLIRDVLATF